MDRTLSETSRQLNETLKDKQDHMRHTFDTEMVEIKTRYTTAVEKVDEQSKNLGKLFKIQVKTIKETSVLFFAKVEMKLKEQNDQVLQVTEMFRHMEITIQDPNKKFDAHIHTLKTAANVFEQDHQAELKMLRDAV